MLFNKYFLAFTIIPLAEIAILIYLSGIIGVPVTILTVIVTAIIGTILVKKSGKEVMENLQSAMRMQGSLSDAILDGAILIVSGVLLITPGFFTDIFGLMIHIPVFKNILKRFLMKKFKDKIQEMDVNKGFGGFTEFGGDKDFSNGFSNTFNSETIEAKKTQDDYYL
jgi:UPF0716 protein FxsA